MINSGLALRRFSFLYMFTNFQSIFYKSYLLPIENDKACNYHNCRLHEIFQ